MVGKRSFAYAHLTPLRAVRSSWDTLLSPDVCMYVFLVKTELSGIYASDDEATEFAAKNEPLLTTTFACPL